MRLKVSWKSTGTQEEKTDGHIWTETGFIIKTKVTCPDQWERWRPSELRFNIWKFVVDPTRTIRFWSIMFNLATERGHLHFSCQTELCHRVFSISTNISLMMQHLIWGWNMTGHRGNLYHEIHLTGRNIPYSLAQKGAWPRQGNSATKPHPSKTGAWATRQINALVLSLSSQRSSPSFSLSQSLSSLSRNSIIFSSLS